MQKKQNGCNGSFFWVLKFLKKSVKTNRTEFTIPRKAKPPL